MLKKVIESSKIDHFVRWFERCEKIAIVSHTSPDGDAIGSSLGLFHFFSSQRKEVKVIMPNDFPDFLKWMPGSNDVMIYEDEKEACDAIIQEADILVCLDFNTPSRVGAMKDILLQTPARKILIDHHPYPEDFCRITMSYPHISSTSELVFRLICSMGYFGEISREGAICIYTGMMTDTGNFTYNSNNEEIYIIIYQLIKKGIDKDAIYRKVFNTYSVNRMKLQGHVINKMTIFPTYHASLITLSEEEKKEFNFEKGDNEGFVNIPLAIDEIILSCFFVETEEGFIKVSLRSQGDFPCNKMAAEYFNGGGHLNASGGEFNGTMEQAIQVYEQALDSYAALLRKG